MPESARPPSKVDIDLQHAIDLLLHDRPIAYHAALARTLGSATAGIFLSQLLYWTPRSQSNDGWIWKTQDQIYEETALTRWEQETARKTLRRVGVIEERRAGVPARLYFRVQMSILTRLLAETSLALGGPREPQGLPGTPGTSVPSRDDGGHAGVSDTRELASHDVATELVPNDVQYVGKPHVSVRLSHQQECGETSDKSAGLPPTNSETTTETTTEKTNSKFRKTPGPKNYISSDDDVQTSPSDTIPKRRPPSSVVRSQNPVPEATTTDDDYQVLAAYISDFAHELSDRAPLAASTTRAVNLYRDSDLSREQFIQHLYTARQITQQRTASIRSVSRNSESTARRKHKMAYFFAVVEDLLVPDQLPMPLPATVATDETLDVSSPTYDLDHAKQKQWRRGRHHGTTPVPQPEQRAAPSSLPPTFTVEPPVPTTTDPRYHETVLQARWRLAANELADQMTTANHQQWIVPLELLEVTNDCALLRSPSASACAYVQSRLAETVARALRVKAVKIQT